ncbi:MAG: SseB family protein, partial [Jiangellaceae bacterium]
MPSESSRPLPSAAFGADDGTADPAVAAALAGYERSDGGSAEVLSALAGSRLLVPVVAVLDELEQVDA